MSLEWHDRLSSVLSSMDYSPRLCEQYVKWHASTYEFPIILWLSGQVDLALSRDLHAVPGRYFDCLSVFSRAMFLLIEWLLIAFSQAHTHRENKVMYKTWDPGATMHDCYENWFFSFFRWLCTASQTWHFSISKDIIWLNLASRYVQ